MIGGVALREGMGIIGGRGAVCVALYKDILYGRTLYRHTVLEVTVQIDPHSGRIPAGYGRAGWDGCPQNPIYMPFRKKEGACGECRVYGGDRVVLF